MATFGDTTAGASSFPYNDDRAIVRPFVMPEDGTATSITLFFDGSSTAAENHKGLIYADAAGLPGALVAVSAAGSLPIGGTSLTLSISASLTAGQTYWLGGVSEEFTGRWAADALVAGQRQEAVTYASPAATFGTPAGSTTDGISVYVTYDPAQKPQIVSNPLDQSVPSGSTPTLLAEVVNYTSLQWYETEDGITFTAVSGATGLTLALPALTQHYQGRQYKLRATGPGGSVDTRPASIGLTDMPVILWSTSVPTGADVWLRDPILTSGGATSVNVSDSAAGSDAISIEVTIAPADAGSGADVASLAVPLALADSGAGSDADALSVTQAQADSGAGSDAISAAPSITPTDTSSGTDQTAIDAAAGISDSGAGSDAAALSASLPLADSGAGSDSISVTAAVTAADAGAGTDSVAPAADIAPSDSASGSDSQALAADVAASDSASGVDQVSVAQNATPINVSDSAAGSDAINVSVTLDAADTGSGSDTQDGTASFAPADAGSGSDAAALDAVIGLNDAGAGVDAINVDTGGPQHIDVADGGVGSDAIEVTKTEGPDLTLIGRNVRFKPLKKPRQPEAPAEPRKPTPSPLIKALVERAKPRSTGVGEVTIAPAPVAPVVIDLPEVRVVATPTPAPKAPPPPPPSPENPVPLPTAAVTPAPKPPERPKPIAVEMVSVPKAAWDALTADVERFALHIATLEAQLADTKGQLAKARRAANQAQAQLLALQLLEE